MGNAGEVPVQASDSVIVADADAGAINEPFMLDFAAMHGENTKERSPLSRRLVVTRPVTNETIGFLGIHRQQQHHHQTSQEGESISLPGPGCSSTPAANKKRISMQRRLSSDTSYLAMANRPEPQLDHVRVPSRTPSSSNMNSASRPATQIRYQDPIPIRSSADSVISYVSSAPSIATQALPPLQQRGAIDDDDRLSPLLEDDPQSFDLVAPMENERRQSSLEDQSDLLFSKQHLQAIFNDTPSLLRFTSFLSTARPQSVPVLIYYLDALKALRAISYANAVAEALEPIDRLEFTENPARATLNAVLEEKANQAFDVLVSDDLPAFITHVFTQVASVSISKRVTGNLPPILREASEGLAEVFCLSDPSRTDNPIIFASEEFHRTTQYGVGYAIGRNCRFLQGPKTNRSSVTRFGEMIRAGKEHSEVFLNYRRDGSPFMNLLMCAPLLDSRGTLRYFIGAQIDVSGLVRDGTDLEAFQRLRQEKEQEISEKADEPRDEFQELCKMFNNAELDIVRKYGGNMHREQIDEQDDASSAQHRPRVLIQDQSTFDHVEEGRKLNPKVDGRLSGPYKHYLLIRPAPSLRILFSSPSLRVPGILQSPFLDRVGGSNRVRASVGNALADGSRGVTAKIRWLSRPVADLENSYEEGRPRWIHCTPLLGASGSVGVWMVVLIDEDRHVASRRFRQAPPIASDVRSRQGGERNRLDDYDDMNSGYASQTWSRIEGQGHGTGVARLATSDALRQPSSPRSIGNLSEQRAMRSPGSPMRGYGVGSNGSMETFGI